MLYITAMKQKIGLTVIALFLSILAKPQQQYYLVTGTYTSGKSEGIYVYRFNTGDGTVEAVSSIKISNPSFIAVSPDEKYVYAVQENGDSKGTGGAIAALSFDNKSGSLAFLNQQPSGGDHPCYTSTDKTGKWVATGNYTSGSFSIHPVMENGSLGTVISNIKHEGSGPNKVRQKTPHVHATFFSPDNRFLYVPDLGIDKVMIYAFDEKTGKISTFKQPFAASKPGSGPRHICFNPTNTHAYVIEELSGTVAVYAYKNGKFKDRQRISSMPTGDTGFAGSADIHVSPDGKFLYASNRASSNTIAIFRINQKNGKLSLIGNQPTLGNTPRNFNVDPTGNFLLVANQNSDAIVIFKVDKETGLLSDTGNRIEVGKPVCLKWISIP
jgi:6-phosphogluconolactonase